MSTTTLNPVETPGAISGILGAYKALLMLREGGLLDFISEKAYDPEAKQQCEWAIEAMEGCMSPNLRLITLPGHTKVRFATADDPDRIREGLVRDMAWDTDLRRRITTTGQYGGWEFFSNANTVYAHFEVSPD